MRGRIYMLAVACCFGLLASVSGAAQSTDSHQRADAADWQLSCGYEPFLATAFDNPTGAENENHPSAAALRRFLKGPYIGYEFPDVGEIRLLTRNETHAQYSAGDPTRKGIAVVAFEAEETGTRWDFAGLSGSCRPESVQKGYNVAEWRLPRKADPEVPHATDSLSVLVKERDCASGSNPKKRLAEPVVSYGPRRIAVIVRVRPPKGNFQTCQGNPWVSHTIELDEPVGARTVVDGGTFPYRPRVNPR